jgi:hypothetical protein
LGILLGIRQKYHKTVPTDNCINNETAACFSTANSASDDHNWDAGTMNVWKYQKNNRTEIIKPACTFCKWEFSSKYFHPR